MHHTLKHFCGAFCHTCTKLLSVHPFVWMSQPLYFLDVMTSYLSTPLSGNAKKYERLKYSPRQNHSPRSQTSETSLVTSLFQRMEMQAKVTGFLFNNPGVMELYIPHKNSKFFLLVRLLPLSMMQVL